MTRIYVFVQWCCLFKKLKITSKNKLKIKIKHFHLINIPSKTLCICSFIKTGRYIEFEMRFDIKNGNFIINQILNKDLLWKLTVTKSPRSYAITHFSARPMWLNSLETSLIFFKLKDESFTYIYTYVDRFILSRFVRTVT